MSIINYRKYVADIYKCSLELTVMFNNHMHQGNQIYWKVHSTSSTMRQIGWRSVVPI